MHREDPIGVGIVHEILDALPPAIEARIEGDKGGCEMSSVDALEFFVVDVRELLILHIAVPPPVVEITGMVDAEVAEPDDERDALIIRAERVSMETSMIEASVILCTFGASGALSSILTSDVG